MTSERLQHDGVGLLLGFLLGAVLGVLGISFAPVLVILMPVLALALSATALRESPADMQRSAGGAGLLLGNGCGIRLRRWEYLPRVPRHRGLLRERQPRSTARVGGLYVGVWRRVDRAHLTGSPSKLWRSSCGVPVDRRPIGCVRR